VPIKIEYSNLLIVEGYDEKCFFEQLIKYLDLHDIQIENVGGKNNFKNKLPVILKTPGFSNVKKLAIIRDADKDDTNAFSSIVNILKKVEEKELTLPKKKSSFSNGNPQIGIYIMPGNSNMGMLEDLCLETVKDHPAMKCVDSFYECVSKLTNPPKIPSKAKAQAFLAAMPEIKQTVRAGAEKSYWDFNSPALDDLKEFINYLD